MWDVTMRLDALRLSDDQHRVVRFCPRSKADGAARWRGFDHDRGPITSPVESLAKYERDGHEDDYRHRMVMNGLAFVVTVGLIAAGVWLAANIDDEGPTAAHASTFGRAFN
jgi:hypothetical protein